MKRIIFILILVSLWCFCLQAQSSEKAIVNLWVETNRLVYDNNEVILFQVSFSDPKGLNGNISLLTTDGKIQAFQILPWYIIGQTGAQAEFPILEKVPGKYMFQGKFLNNGKMVVSNEVEITINSTSLPLPSVGSRKTENAIIDGYEFWWTRTYADQNGDGVAEWGKPMPLGEPHRVYLAPAKKSNFITWASLKSVEVAR